MEKNFEATLQFILKEEGGFARDHAGATQMGITIGLMKALKLDLDGDGSVTETDVRLVDADMVRNVFRQQFWNMVGADTLPTGLDLIASDFAFNAGPVAAKRMLAYREIAIYTIARMHHYYNLAFVTNPARYRRYYEGWMNRSLRAYQRATELIRGNHE